MTMTMLRVSVACLALLTSGCASVQQPSAEVLSKLPIVQFGEAVPAGNDYILFFPADKPIPTNVAIKGSIFAREAEQRLNVTLRRDIYAYKHWISYDRVNWLNAQEAIKTDIQIQIPGYTHPEPGLMKIQMDERK
jgi:hypothetical protein